MEPDVALDVGEGAAAVQTVVVEDVADGGEEGDAARVVSRGLQACFFGGAANRCVGAISAQRPFVVQARDHTTVDLVAA